jgi:hypothetical protein
MGQLVLLVVAAVWAAVLVPPLLRSRIENRPNSSVSDFRDQLSSLQRAMPSHRGVAMRSMARPLAPSPLSRPAAAGRPNLTVHGRTHAGTASRPGGHLPAGDRRRRPETARALYDATPRVRSHADRVARPVSSRAAVKRRRANVLFVLALVAGCSLFLAATTRSQPMIWLAVAACGFLIAYVCLLGQLRQRELEPAPSLREAARRPAPQSRRHLAERPGPAPAASRQRTARQAPSARQSDARQPAVRQTPRQSAPRQSAPRQQRAPRPSAVRRSPDRWSHAV